VCSSDLDFKSLPDATKELIRSIKRVRVVLGTVELVNPKDADGNPVDLEATPFIWEVENRDAFKNIGGAFTQLAKMKRLPVQHIITANTEERKIPTGAVFYLPVVSLDVTKTLDLTNKEQDMFDDFMHGFRTTTSTSSMPMQKKQGTVMEMSWMSWTSTTSLTLKRWRNEPSC